MPITRTDHTKVVDSIGAKLEGAGVGRRSQDPQGGHKAQDGDTQYGAGLAEPTETPLAEQIADAVAKALKDGDR